MNGPSNPDVHTAMQHRCINTSLPVPCTATMPTADGSSSPDASAVPSRACWLGPLGAVRLLLRPSWLTALPRICARMEPASAKSPAELALPL